MVTAYEQVAGLEEDAVQAVDLTFDALINEIDVSKMCVFLSDVLFDREKSGDKAVSIPFGKQDMAEVGVTMNAWEYRAKWYDEDEKTAKARARGLKRADGADASSSKS